MSERLLIYRALFRAARDLYRDCAAERSRAEAAPIAFERLVGAKTAGGLRLERARAREAALRDASRALVRQIDGETAAA